MFMFKEKNAMWLLVVFINFLKIDFVDTGTEKKHDCEQNTKKKSLYFNRNCWIQIEQCLKCTF